MKKKNNATRKIFYLDNDAVAIIREISQSNGLSMSAQIEQWAFSFDENLNPHKKIQRIQKEKKALKDQLSLLEKEEEKYITQMSNVEEWRKKRQSQKPQIVQNIARLILEKRFDDVETVAKTQGIRFGLNPMELIAEAQNLSKRI
jgi:hypothetical protein